MSLVEQVSRLVRERAGLQLDAVMRTRLVRALGETRRRGEDDAALLLRLRSDASVRQALYDELTVQETSFFRDAAHFTGLAETVLPSLPDPVVLWSAGCSNGQEAWSLAMVLAEQGRNGQVVVTDLSERALARTREGRYAERELRGLSAERRDRWFVQEGSGPTATYSVVPALRRLVRVDRHNLATDPPPVPQASVVFCRNVLIYFGRADVVTAVGRFRHVLRRDGWLFLGFSETLWTLSDAFVPVRMGEAYAYRPAGAPALPTLPGAPALRTSAAVAGERPVRRGRPTVPVLDDLRDAPWLPGSPRSAYTRVGESTDVAELLAHGERALRAGLAADGVSAFRGAAYLAPDLPLPHLELGHALYALGEKAAARRALQTARRVLGSSTGDVAGWEAATLRRWIDDRLAAVEADARVPAQRASSERAARVLVVDDSPLIRAILVASLEEQGYVVIEAEDGTEALEVCQIDPPDVVLLDVVMPGLSSLDVLDRLQAEPDLLHVPVVCLTGRSDVTDIVEAMERGAHDHLRKPFETSELLARLSSALRVKRLSDELRSRNAELERVSRTDGLTGLLNRRAVEEILHAQLAHASRHDLPLSVLMIDLDEFKKVNDTFGHAAGDRVLVDVSARLRAFLREGDHVGRWGGEEFLAVLPLTGGPAALLLAERLCGTVAAHPVLLPDGTRLEVGVSIGSCGATRDEEALLRRADDALYRVKAGGRGRAVSGD